MPPVCQDTQLQYQDIFHLCGNKVGNGLVKNLIFDDFRA